MQPGYRSQWARYVGGAAKPTMLPLFRPGDRSPLFYWGGGATKPPSTGEYAGPRSMLAHWMGGAALNYRPKPERELIVGGEGIPFAKHRGKPIDDDEIIEFLRLWVSWQDIE